jgi:hypothetical protein
MMYALVKLTTETTAALDDYPGRFHDAGDDAATAELLSSPRVAELFGRWHPLLTSC